MINQCMRYDIDGNPTEAVKPEEAEQAKLLLKQLKKRISDGRKKGA